MFLSQTCQVPATSVGLIGVASYIFYRHQHYHPPTLTQLTEKMLEEIKPIPPTTTAGLPLEGPLQSTGRFITNTASSTTARLRHALNVVGPPLRFYQRNLFIGAAILGTGTAIGQRIICGKHVAKPKINIQH